VFKWRFFYRIWKEVSIRKVFVVIGMHRSGTSCLAGCLRHGGVDFGKVSRTNRFNRKGTFELTEIQAIHDQILALNNCSWFNPPIRELEVHDYHKKKLREILETLEGSETLGVKDPRILFLLPLWKELLGDKIQLIGSFRRPFEVALSLRKRNKLELSKGLEMWRRYNSNLINEHKRKPFPIVHYNLLDRNVYLDSIRAVLKSQNLRDSSTLMDFVDDSLMHNRDRRELQRKDKMMLEYLLINSVKNV